MIVANYLKFPISKFKTKIATDVVKFSHEIDCLGAKTKLITGKGPKIEISAKEISKVHSFTDHSRTKHT